MTDPLISASLLGSTRSPVLPASPDADLRPAWDEMRSRPPAEALLHALSITRAYRLAGSKTAEASPASEPAPDDDSPLLSEIEIDALLRMLRGNYKEVMPEWLAAISPSGRVVPARILPEILDAGKKTFAWRPGLALLAGKRGRWIAAHDDAHAWLLESQSGGQQTWDSDSAAERLDWLRKFRSADPAAAAELISLGWNGESPDFREALTELASQAPASIDESWLQNLAMKERRQQTRNRAIAALIQLPDSAFARRALQRAAPLVRMTRKLLRQVITVEPPEAFDPAWATDQMIETPPSGVGAKAWWLRQLIASVPLAFWPKHLGIEAAELFSKSIDSDWKEPLFLGWIDAAMAAPRLALAPLFIPFLTRLDPWPKGASPKRIVISTLLQAVSSAQREPLMDQLAESLAEGEFIDLLANADGTIPAKQGSRTLAALRKAIDHKPSTLFVPDARRLALAILPADIRIELERLSRLPELTTTAEAFATTLEFRQSLFTKTAAP